MTITNQVVKTTVKKTRLLDRLFLGVKAWRFVAICSLTMAILTGLPYVFGYIISPDDKVFMGMTTGDIAQYMAWMRGFTKANLIDNHLTAEASDPVFFNLLWWTLAKISVFLSLDSLVTIHLYRVFTIIFFAVVLYWFIGLVLSDERQRRTAFLVAYFGGGLGWIWVIEKYAFARSDVLFPLDVYAIEANSFESLLGINHFSISAALMTSIYGLFILGYERKQWRYILLASLAALALGWEHAYDLLLVYSILGAFVVVLFIRDGFLWKLVLYPLVIGLASVWAALYSVYITNAFPIWKAVLAQFANAEAWTPDPFHLLILLGLPFIIALFTFDGLVPLKERSTPDLFVRTWFVINLFVVYVPLNFQVHYLNGWQIPIAILATYAFFVRVMPWLLKQSLFEKLGKMWPKSYLERALLATVLLLVVLVNIYLLAWRFVVLTRLPHEHFLTQSEAAALDWLGDTVIPEDIVLSAITVGQYIPSRTGARAFLAHWAMTKDIYQKQEMVEAFFKAETTDEERQRLLKAFSIDYILVGLEEQQLGSYNPAASSYLEPCFTAPQAAVYCVYEEKLIQTED